MATFDELYRMQQGQNNPLINLQQIQARLPNWLSAPTPPNTNTQAVQGFANTMQNIGRADREQQGLDIERERARALADVQMQTFQAEQANLAQKRQAREGFAAENPEYASLINAGYGKEAAKAMTTPEKLSTAMRTYQEAGGAKTGMSFLEFLESPAAPGGDVINVGGAVKPPNIPGLALVQDPNEATGWRYEKVGGAPEKGMRPEQIKAAEYTKQADFAQAGVDRLREKILKYGTEGMPGGERESMVSNVRAVMLSLAKVFDMGQLEGGDERIVKELMGDPTERFSSLKGVQSFLSKLEEVDRIIADKRRIYGEQEPAGGGNGKTTVINGVEIEEVP